MRTVVAITVVMIATSLVLSGIKRCSGGSYSSDEEEILAAFDAAVEDVAGYRFPARMIVSKEQISNYAVYADTAYVGLCGLDAMYSALVFYLQQDDDTRKQIINEQKTLIRSMERADTVGQNELSLEKQRLRYMEGLNGKDSMEFVKELANRTSDLNEKKTALETKSPGWKYVIEGKMAGGTVCRFIFVAPEDEPLRLTIAGGGVVEQ